MSLWCTAWPCAARASATVRPPVSVSIVRVSLMVITAQATVAGDIAPDQVGRLRTPPAPDNTRPVGILMFRQPQGRQRLPELHHQFRLLLQDLDGEIGYLRQTFERIRFFRAEGLTGKCAFQPFTPCLI